jgi:hypothetical protein
MGTLLDLDLETDAVVVVTIDGVRRAYTRQTLTEVLGGTAEASTDSDSTRFASQLSAAQLGRSLAWVVEKIKQSKTTNYSESMDAWVRDLLNKFDGKIPERPSKIGGLVLQIAEVLGETPSIAAFLSSYSGFLYNAHPNHKAKALAYLSTHRDI